MKNNILKYICILSLIFCFFPLHVHADSTYTVINNGECLNVITTSGHYQYFSIRNAVSEVRSVVILSGNTAYFYYVSLSSFQRSNYSSSSACSSNYSNSNYYVLDDVTYYYSEYAFNNSGSTSWDYVSPKFNALDSSSLSKYVSAIYYTFGAGSVAPIEPVNWGILRDVNYNTRYAGNGLAGVRNVDYINWNSYIDANGNDLSECTVEIQAVPGYWRGTDYQDYISKGVNDFLSGDISPVTIGTVSANTGTFSISWSGVINEFGLGSKALFSNLHDGLYESLGWYYQVRLLAPDDYIGSWQTVYTPLSLSAEASQSIVNNTSITNETYQIFEELTQVNNQTNIQLSYIDLTGLEVTIQIDNPVSTPEPSASPEPTASPEVVPYDDSNLIAVIRNGFFNLINNLSSLPGKIWSGFLDLFSFDGFTDEVTQSFSDAKENLLHGNNFIGQILTFESDMHQTIISIQHAEPVLSWDSIYLGETELVAAGQYNLNDWLEVEAVSDLYDVYLVIIRGVCYLALVIFVWRQFQEVLEK